MSSTIRRKLIFLSCSHIAQPPMPGLPIERSIAHPSLLADILVSKYADHLALYRQEMIAARDGVTLDRGSWGDGLGDARHYAPLIDALRRYTMAGTKVHADDTPIPVLASGNKKTKTGACGSTFVGTAARVRLNLRLCGSRIHRTAKVSIPRPISPISRASCRRMRTVASTSCFPTARSLKLHAGTTRGESCRGSREYRQHRHSFRIRHSRL